MFYSWCTLVVEDRFRYVYTKTITPQSMKKGETKSIRLNVLLKMCQRKDKMTTYAELLKKCKSWGVCKATADRYIVEVWKLVE